MQRGWHHRRRKEAPSATKRLLRNFCPHTLSEGAKRLRKVRGKSRRSYRKSNCCAQKVARCRRFNFLKARRVLCRDTKTLLKIIKRNCCATSPASMQCSIDSTLDGSTIT